MIQKKIVDYLLSIAFVLNLAVGMISNYSTNIFLVKAVTSLLLLLLIFFDIRVNKIDSVKLLKENNPKRLLIILVLFIAYLSLTLTYSSDPQYGFQKILNFLLSAIPSVFAFYYLVITFDEKRLQVFINSLVMFTIVTVLYIVIDYPFEQGTLYEFRPERWSHVIYGRIIGCIAVVLLLYILSNFNQPRTVHYGLRTIFLVMATSLAVYGLYLSALRSAFLGLLIVGGG
ncbi:MAG: hypothetical protein HKO83_08435, partial [Ignavibacteriaceae bacterium]|nr:hypothetical protein [Ignavibacteriaceae bacterium]